MSFSNATVSITPVDLNHIELTGAIRFGSDVTHLAIRLADGRFVEFDLPVRAVPVEDMRFTYFEARIVELFQRNVPDARIKGVQIASILKEKIDTLKKHLANLVRLDVLDNDKGSVPGYFRGSKFPQMPDDE